MSSSPDEQEENAAVLNPNITSEQTRGQLLRNVPACSHVVGFFLSTLVSFDRNKMFEEKLCMCKFYKLCFKFSGI